MRTADKEQLTKTCELIKLNKNISYCEFPNSACGNRFRVAFVPKRNLFFTIVSLWRFEF